MIQKIKLFLGESQQEFKRVNWPSFKETFYLTTIVIGMSLLVAIFLGLFDFIFTTILKQLI